MTTKNSESEFAVSCQDGRLALWVPKEKSVGLTAGGSGRNLVMLHALTPEERTAIAIGIAPWLKPPTKADIDRLLEQLCGRCLDDAEDREAVAQHLAGNLGPMEVAQ